MWIEPLPEAELGPDYIWEAVSAFPGLKGAPRAWDTHSANVLTSSTQIEQSQYDGCLFYRLEPSRERIEEKAGRHIDDFLVTGLEPNVEHFLEQARDKLNMQDAVRSYKTGDEGRLLAMNLRQLDNGYSLQGKPFLIHGIATALGMENATTSLIPETINEKAQDGDDESLTPSEARIFRTCVGKAMYLSHHRPDIQHDVNTFEINEESDDDSNAKAQEAYPLLVYQELCPDPRAERCKCQSTAIGLTTEKLVKAAVEEQFSFTDAQCSRGHARKRRELFRAQGPSCTALAQEQSKVWEQHNF